MAVYRLRYSDSEDDPREQKRKELERFLSFVGPRDSPQGQIARGDWALQHLSDSPTLSVTDPEGTTYSAGGLRNRRDGNFPNATGYRGRDPSEFGTPLGLGQGTPEQQQSMELAKARQTLSPEQFQSQFPNAIPQGGRKSGLTMVNSPYGGQLGVSPGRVQSYLDKGYTISTPPRTAAQQFDLNQAYAQGYGAPNPTIQQGPGGTYRIAGGVAAPTGSAFPSLSRFGSDVATAARGATALARGIGTFAANLFNRNTQPSQPSTYASGGYANTGPRRYFDY